MNDRPTPYEWHGQFGPPENWTWRERLVGRPLLDPEDEDWLVEYLLAFEQAAMQLTEMEEERAADSPEFVGMLDEFDADPGDWLHIGVAMGLYPPSGRH